MRKWRHFRYLNVFLMIMDAKSKFLVVVIFLLITASLLVCYWKYMLEGDFPIINDLDAAAPTDISN